MIDGRTLKHSFAAKKKTILGIFSFYFYGIFNIFHAERIGKKDPQAEKKKIFMKF